MDNGDFIVVVNCEKIKVTGNKLQDKNTTGIPAGWADLKTSVLGDVLAQHPDRRSCPPCAACCPKTVWVAPC